MGYGRDSITPTQNIALAIENELTIRLLKSLILMSGDILCFDDTIGLLELCDHSHNRLGLFL